MTGRTTIRMVRATVLATATATVLVLAAVPRPVRAAEPPRPLTAEESEALHSGMLRLRHLERSGDRAGAIRDGQALLVQFPGNRRVEDALLTLYRQERRDDDLLALLRERVKRNPEDGESVRELASAYLARNDQGAARSVLQKLIDGNPKDENRYRLAATLFAARGFAEPAIRFYRAGRDAIGDPALFAAELAQLERARGDDAAALGEFLLLAENPDRRMRAQREIAELLERSEDPNALLSRMESIRKQRPKSAAIHDIVAHAYLEQGRFGQALDAVRAADREAGDQGEHLLDFGRAALTRATAEGDAARAKAGVEALQLVAERHPQSNLIPEATRLAAEGLVAVARGIDDDGARRALLEQAVRTIDASGGARTGAAESDDRALALKAMILFEDLNRPQEALVAFEELARRKRERGEPDELLRVQIALCRAALGELDAARGDLEAIVQADSAAFAPPFPGARRPKQPRDIGWSRARFHLAQLDMVAERYDEAREAFAALAEEAPEDRLANDCLDLALLLNEGIPAKPLGLYGEAVQARLLRDRTRQRKALETLIEQHPESALVPVAQFEVASVLAEEHDTEPALARFDAMLRAHPQHRLAPRALESIGDLQAQVQHRPDLAVASYERLLLEYPDDLFLDGVRKKLLAARAAKEGGNATP